MLLMDCSLFNVTENNMLAFYVANKLKLFLYINCYCVSISFTCVFVTGTKQLFYRYSLKLCLVIPLVISPIQLY